jgi:hypothetical protein
MNVMQDADGTNWIYPAQGPRWISLGKLEFHQLLNHYDLSAGAVTRTNFKFTTRNGFRYFPAQ